MCTTFVIRFQLASSLMTVEPYRLCDFRDLSSNRLPLHSAKSIPEEASTTATQSFISSITWLLLVVALCPAWLLQWVDGDGVGYPIRKKSLEMLSATIAEFLETPSEPHPVHALRRE